MTLALRVPLTVPWLTVYCQRHKPVKGTEGTEEEGTEEEEELIHKMLILYVETKHPPEAMRSLGCTIQHGPVIRNNTLGHPITVSTIKAKHPFFTKYFPHIKFTKFVLSTSTVY